ncbi:hypothetical protein B0H17DRAFT_1149059 [Mycena rosella]|uniref:Secreted protein n=1 Tax=Mycena rosella TaxID=1033263 RepID=A0AAD7C6E4_MYCRO|nr:hypothetical protein B0H17DRAFT_1149059 [Mycena rosella]
MCWRWEVGWATSAVAAATSTCTCCCADGLLGGELTQGRIELEDINGGGNRGWWRGYTGMAVGSSMVAGLHGRVQMGEAEWRGEKSLMHAWKCIYTEQHFNQTPQSPTFEPPPSPPPTSLSGSPTTTTTSSSSSSPPVSPTALLVVDAWCHLR